MYTVICSSFIKCSFMKYYVAWDDTRSLKKSYFIKLQKKKIFLFKQKKYIKDVPVNVPTPFILYKHALYKHIRLQIAHILGTLQLIYQQIFISFKGFVQKKGCAYKTNLFTNKIATERKQYRNHVISYIIDTYAR